MNKVIKEKLEELVELLNDPDEVVIEKEVKEKLEVILSLLDNPEETAKDKIALQEKLAKVVALVNHARVDSDIEIEYCMPELEEASEACDVPGDPYILVTYVVAKHDERKRKIRLRDTAIRRNTPEDLANQVTFSIEEFKGEIDSVEMG